MSKSNLIALETIPTSAYKRGMIGINPIPCRITEMPEGFCVTTPVFASSKALGLDISVSVIAATKKAGKREAAKGVIGLYLVLSSIYDAKPAKDATAADKAFYRFNRRAAEQLNPYIKLSEPTNDAENKSAFRGDLNFSFALSAATRKKVRVALAT